MPLLQERNNIMQREQKVYQDLYDITKNNIEKAGMDMAFSRDAFLYSTKRDLKYVNAFDMPQYDNQSLLQVLYIAFFFRTPEENARINWGKLNDMPPRDFQEKVFKTLSSSQEFIKNGTIICNNMYCSPDIKISAAISTASNINPYINKLYNYYRKLPLPLKKIIKLIVGGSLK